jgi:hypothetical protein
LPMCYAMVSSAVCSCSVKCSPTIAIGHRPPSCAYHCNANGSNDQARSCKEERRLEAVRCKPLFGPPPWATIVRALSTASPALA